MAFLVTLILGLGQGLLHSLGPDHCAALVTLSGRSPRGALALAMRFALGHALTLASVSALCLFLGVGLSEAFEVWTERLGGAVLIALSLAALFFPATHEHGHPHMGLHAADHAHPGVSPGAVSLSAGALIALSGARALLLSLPPLLVGSTYSLAALAYIPGFGLGVLAGMGTLGVLLAVGLDRLPARAVHRLHQVATIATAALGVFWIWSHR